MRGKVTFPFENRTEECWKSSRKCLPSRKLYRQRVQMNLEASVQQLLQLHRDNSFQLQTLQST